MLNAIAIIPSAPVLVPELAGGAAAELTELRSAVCTAAGALAPRWIAVGVGTADAVIGPTGTGTFAGYGVDLPVALAPDGSGPPVHWPLCALIAGWVRGQAAPEATVEVRVYAADHSGSEAVGLGRALRAELDAATDPVGVLVVADGANMLTSAAPGGYRPDTIPMQDTLDDTLSAGDAVALTRLPDAIVGRVAYQILAGLAGSERVSVSALYRGAPYGVGYFAGVWKP